MPTKYRGLSPVPAATDYVPDIQKVALDRMIVDPSYQRKEKPQIIAMIMDDFQGPLAGILDVAGPYPGGIYKVWDGQNRAEAMRQLHIVEWWCNVVPPDTAAEAKLFAESNSQRSQTTPIEDHRAALVAGDEVAHTVEAAVVRAGRVLGSNAIGGIPAIKACYDVFKRWDADVLYNTLVVLTASWGRSVESCRMPLIMGIAAVLGKHPEVDDKALVKKLHRHEPVVYWNAARLRYAGNATSGTRGHDVYRYTVDIWNKNLPASKRIDPI